VTTAAIDVVVKPAAAFRYVAPFALFLVLLTLAPHLPLSPLYEAELRFAILGAACVVCWPVEISFVPKAPIASILIGLGVFALWIAPDVLIPGYRDLPLFSNQFIGRVHSSLPPSAFQNAGVLAWRTARAALIVPIVEELFWRGWLMRWLINRDFYRVPLGKYAPASFTTSG
jgi:CAAX prenyl protease-like protein